MWDNKLIEPAALHGFADGNSLADLCHALLAQQRTVWPRLAQGCDALDQIETKVVELSAWPVTVQFNPARATSSLAKVDAASIARRPCFLCVGNLPPEQRGIRTGDFVLLTNPAPIVPGHLTVAHERHTPQQIEAYLEPFVTLAEKLSGQLTVLYNGPRCGASAPDHMHFQATPFGAMPIERQLGDGVCDGEYALARGTRIRLLTDAADAASRARHLFELVSQDEEELIDALRRTITALPPHDDGEPLLNLFTQHNEGQWTVILFPRAAHRPRCYFEEGNGQMLLSPGVLDMAGQLITVREQDFARANAATLSSLYREVTNTTATCQAVMKTLRAG
ncbi:MAG: DUF4922 domain-containing protein [Phycisphaerae bacterium]|nr:DUF4922 domain-containing protein [Phycisphaerae bacterium]